MAPVQGADFAQFPPLGFSRLPIPSARHRAARGGPQLASRTLTIRLQFTTLQLCSRRFVLLADIPAQKSGAEVLER